MGTNEKQQQLIEAVIDLFANEGFWNSSTSRIATHAGVVIAEYAEDGSVKTRFEDIWFRYIAWGVDNAIRHDLFLQRRLSDLVHKEAHQERAEEASAIAASDLMEMNVFRQTRSHEGVLTGLSITSCGSRE